MILNATCATSCALYRNNIVRNLLKLGVKIYENLYKVAVSLDFAEEIIISPALPAIIQHHLVVVVVQLQRARCAII